MTGRPEAPGQRARLKLWCVVLALGSGCASAADPDATTQRTAPTEASQQVVRMVRAPPHYAHPAASDVRPERPVSLRLPSGTGLPVDASITDALGRLSLPDDVGRAGWWRGSARLGDPFGAIVVAAHVDSFAQGLGPIAELLGAGPGDLLTLESRGLHHEFVVSSVRFVPRTELGALAPLLSFAGSHRLVVITCGGPYDRDRGGYRDNLVVVAEPAEPLRRR